MKKLGVWFGLLCLLVLCAGCKFVVEVSSVEIPDTLEITVGETGTLAATVYPPDATIDKVEWRSNGDPVVEVFAGGMKGAVATVEAQFVGQTTVKAYVNGVASKECKVKVTEDENENWNWNGNGTNSGAAPKTMYMIGDQFGGWSWESDGVVALIPIWGTKGKFWCTRWFDATKGFKFCSVKEWNGDFTGAGTVGYTVSDGNCWVAESGFYTVFIDGNDGTVEISPAKVYGIGDAVFNGGWDFDCAEELVAEGDKLVITTSGAGELRLASKVVPTIPDDQCTRSGWYDWWKTEFVFYEDGKIVYRAGGNDQERFNVEAGKTISLDFNAGTATVGVAFAGKITIDGDFSDWSRLDPGVVSIFVSDPDAPWDAVEEIRCYANGKDVFYYIKYNQDCIEELLADKSEQLPIRLCINTDGEFTSGYLNYFLDGYDFIIEGATADKGSFCKFYGTLHQRISGSWVTLLPPGNGLVFGNGSGCEYEISLDRAIFNNAANASTVPLPMGNVFQTGIRFYTTYNGYWNELSNMPNSSIDEGSGNGYGHLMNVRVY